MCDQPIPDRSRWEGLLLCLWVVLLDLLMPRMGGVEAIRAIKDRNPAARILVLTSFAEDEKVYAAIKAGALGYLLKDASPGEILAVGLDEYMETAFVLSRDGRFRFFRVDDGTPIDVAEAEPPPGAGRRYGVPRWDRSAGSHPCRASVRRPGRPSRARIPRRRSWGWSARR